MQNKTTLTLLQILAISKVFKQLLYVDGVSQERPIPFRLKFRINKILLQTQVDENYFQNEKNKLIVKYGAISKDKTRYEVKKKNKNKYLEELYTLLDTKRTHVFCPIETEDLEKIEDVVSIDYASLELLAAYIAQDINYINNLNITIN